MKRFHSSPNIIARFEIKNNNSVPIFSSVDSFELRLSKCICEIAHYMHLKGGMKRTGFARQTLFWWINRIVVFWLDLLHKILLSKDLLENIMLRLCRVSWKQQMFRGRSKCVSQPCNSCYVVVMQSLVHIWFALYKWRLLCV